MNAQKYLPISNHEKEDSQSSFHSMDGCVTISKLERRGLWGSVICLAVGFIISIALSSARSSSSVAKSDQNTAATQPVFRPLDPQDFFPPIGQRSMVFNKNKQFEDTGALGDRSWQELIPAGEGYVRVPHPKRFDIHESSPVPDDKEFSEYYMISVVHQLHCLGIVRDALVSAKNGNNSAAIDDPHTYHCLDYVRQGIICAGDTTMEWARAEYDSEGNFKRWFFDGSGSTHTCRDYPLIKEFLEGHQ